MSEEIKARLIQINHEYDLETRNNKRAIARHKESIEFLEKENKAAFETMQRKKIAALLVSETVRVTPQLRDWFRENSYSDTRDYFQIGDIVTATYIFEHDNRIGLTQKKDGASVDIYPPIDLILAHLEDTI